MFRYTVTLCVTAFILEQSSAYRILGLFPFNARSHEMMFESLMVGLAKRGHRVDVITHFPIANPPQNYKVVMNLSGTLENVVNNFTIDFVTNMADEVSYFIAAVYGNKLCNLMGLEDFQKFIKNPPNDPPYDVLITEAFGANCFMGIGHHFNVPIVAVSSAVEYPWVSFMTGNNDNPAVVPNGLFMAFGQMDFWQRLRNTISYYYEVTKFHKNTEDIQSDLMRKYINPNMPNIREVEKSVALTLVNSHPILFGVKPVLPTLVQVGGLHVQDKNTKLPKDLEKWMNESKDGVVFFTLGSMVLIETLSEKILRAFYKSFAKIAPIRVLIKVANTSKLPPGLPENILTSPWIPQQPVLAHNNTRLFITHGGLMGTQEALYYGIPLIGIPLFADQPRNIESFVAKNMTIKLSLDEISEKTLDAALHAILYDPKYRTSAKHFSKLFRDRPLSAMDTAVFWVEYIIRNGANALRPPSLNMNLWQLALIDVYFLIFLVIILATVLFYYMLKLILPKIISLLIIKDRQNKKKIN